MTTEIELRNIQKWFGSNQVIKDFNLTIAPHEFIVMLGQSGCGKTTTLRAIAGLETIDDGDILIDGEPVQHLKCSDRDIAMVFQSFSLYPHMTVYENIAFPLRATRMGKADIDKAVKEIARILQISDLLDKRPSALSGGDMQRVAIGRALVRDVDVFLFDEPLSNLDAKLRADLRVEIKQLHQRLENTMIYVTHDQTEAMTLADRIAIMKGGNVLQFDTPNEIYNRPASRYVAEFIGSPSMNFVEGTVDLSASPRFAGTHGDFALDGYAFAGRPAGGPAAFGIRPEHIVCGPEAQAKPIHLDTKVDLVEPLGSDTLAWVHAGDQPFWVRMDGQSTIRPGDRLPIGFDPARANLFDMQTEARI